MENNTIILMHGTGEIDDRGDTIFGVDNSAKEVMRWSIGDEAAAKAELAKHVCKYSAKKTFNGSSVVSANEWALLYCECDEDGDLVDGGDYRMAEAEDEWCFEVFSEIEQKMSKIQNDFDGIKDLLKDVYTDLEKIYDSSDFYGVRDLMDDLEEIDSDHADFIGDFAEKMSRFVKEESNKRKHEK